MMNKALGSLAAAALLLAPAAMAATPPPRGGTIAIEPRTADGGYDPALPIYADAAAATLGQKGFTRLDEPDHAAWVAELVLNRATVGTGTARVAGQRKAAMAGLGVAVPLSTGRSDLVPLQRTRLELRIHRRGDTGVVWDGAAVTVRAGDTPKGADAAVAADLAQAILQAYPAQPRAEIGVP